MINLSPCSLAGVTTQGCISSKAVWQDSINTWVYVLVSSRNPLFSFSLQALRDSLFSHIANTMFYMQYQSLNTLKNNYCFSSQLQFQKQRPWPYKRKHWVGGVGGGLITISSEVVLSSVNSVLLVEGKRFLFLKLPGDIGWSQCGDEERVHNRLDCCASLLRD